jgi:hypothetical protein
MQTDEGLVELPSIIEERSNFRDAIRAAREFAFEADCVVTVMRRDALLHEYWKIMIPRSALHWHIARLKEQQEELDQDHQRYLENKEAEFEERFQRDLAYDSQLSNDNFRGRYGSAYESTSEYADDRPYTPQPWD